MNSHLVKSLSPFHATIALPVLFVPTPTIGPLPPFISETDELLRPPFELELELEPELELDPKLELLPKLEELPKEEELLDPRLLEPIPLELELLPIEDVILLLPSPELLPIVLPARPASGSPKNPLTVVFCCPKGIKRKSLPVSGSTYLRRKKRISFVFSN